MIEKGGKMETNSFWGWVEREMEAHNTNYHRVERKGDLANGTISKRAKNLQKPTLRICRAIAHAFTLPLEDVLRKGGLLPSFPMDEEELSFRELLDVVRELPADVRKELLEYARFRYSQTKKNFSDHALAAT